jgi:uncharacterized protein YcfL
MTHVRLESAGRAILALALALTPGCMTTPTGSVNRYSGGEGARAMQSEEHNQLLGAALRIEKLVQTRVNDVLVVQFDLVNTRQSQLGFQWSVDWYDKAGLKIDYAPQNWTPERLAGNAAKTIKIVAPAPQATSWQLQVGSRDEVR